MIMNPRAKREGKEPWNQWAEKNAQALNARGKLEANESLLLSVREVALLLSVSTRTVWRLVSAGELVRPVALGSVARWRRGDVEAFATSLPDVKGILRPKPDKQRIRLKTAPAKHGKSGRKRDAKPM
jgi:excisionase family DNA binding protein